MKSFLLSFLVFLVWSFFAIWLYASFYTSKKNTSLTINTTENQIIINKKDSIQTLKEQKTKHEEKNETTPNYNLIATNDKNEVLFGFKERVIIKKNSDSISIPSTSIQLIDTIINFLESNPDKELQIIAYYGASEIVEIENFGFKRGRKLKQKLVEQGMSSDRIVVKPKIKLLDFNKENINFSGISLFFTKLDPQRIKENKKNTATSKTIYPTFVNNDIIANESLQEEMLKAKEALSLNPNLIIEVIGHTDNIGNANDNYLLGLNYAKQVRWYFINKGGIDKNKVVASS